MEGKNLLDMYQVVVGIFLPLLISTFVKEDWSMQKKGWISFAFVFVAALVHVFFMGELDFVNLPATLIKILFLTTGSYMAFWRPTGIANGIEKNIGIRK